MITALNNHAQAAIQRCKTVLHILIIALFADVAIALPDDKDKPLSIQADSAELDDLNATTTYAGTVVMEKGSMRIVADKVVIHGNNDNYSKVVATGNPALFSQTPRAGQQPVTAQADRLEYFIGKETLHLIDNAALKQEGTSLSGNRIEYDVKKSVVKADSKADGSAIDQRVKMVIPPKALNKTTKTSDDAAAENTQPSSANKPTNQQPDALQ
ncbi:lipopolysaccharide transport periplasmic protein LptA [Teredinibacter waterburyi]|jgi:lipopolysaccharide transport periplasmic protein LptA|uniref:lipopolysaccharide transport periplasmic protein LptA n=1 Tax=Teredinibacter waterburyi TaxID=1500538 RepID=UPI00165F602A|nr:lipopolysaccharide transport periplasmic protein LptA [Teredinibacter waterburyi]